MKPFDLGRLGIPGVAGIGLLLFCISFYVSTLLPAESALAKLRNEEARLATQVATGTVRKPDSSRPVLTLPRASTVPDLLDRLDAAGGGAGIMFDRLSYRMSEEDGMRRYQVTLPLRGEYPTIRAFLRTVMTLSEVVTLDDIELHRANAADPKIDVLASVSFYFAP